MVIFRYWCLTVCYFKTVRLRHTMSVLIVKHYYKIRLKSPIHPTEKSATP